MVSKKPKKLSKTAKKPKKQRRKFRHSELKQQVYDTIKMTKDKKLPGKIFDGVMVGLVLLNVGMSIVATFVVNSAFEQAMIVVETAAVMFFLVDYILRIWTADLHYYQQKSRFLARMRYIFSFWGIVDLLSFLPFCLPFLPRELMVFKLLRTLRVFKVFRVGHTNDAVSTILRTLSSRKAQLLSSVLIIGVLMVAASLMMYELEHEVQPEAFSNAFSGLWWATSAIFTVGYGDVYPVTTLGQVMSIVISILGVGLVAIPTGIISAGFVEQATKSNATYCPHCGKKV